jgi:NADH dehydrogenase FAD-containing subunit
MLAEIDELNNKLNEERRSNDKNESYINLLEEELKIIYEKYKKLQDDIKYLKDYKEISKMTNEKIKKTIKEKIITSKKDEYKAMDINDLKKSQMTD